MSGKNNVNPDHYKVAGRDRQDDTARARRESAPPAKSPKKRKPTPNLIPGAAPAGEAPAADAARRGHADKR